MKNVIIVTRGGVRYAIELRWVREVITLGYVTRVPSAPAHICGVANVRGAITPVLDLVAFRGPVNNDSPAGSGGDKPTRPDHGPTHQTPGAQARKDPAKSEGTRLSQTEQSSRDNSSESDAVIAAGPQPSDCADASESDIVAAVGSRATLQDLTRHGAVLVDIEGVTAAIHMDTVEEVSTVSERVGGKMPRGVTVGVVEDSCGREVLLIDPPAMLAIARDAAHGGDQCTAVPSDGVPHVVP